MDTKAYIDSLFTGYEETKTLRDFKEELQSNLDDRIASLIARGMRGDEAFEKASGELGDISVLADQISLRKKQEIFQDAYLGIRKYLRPGRVAVYVGAGVLVILGAVIAMLVYFTGETQSALEAFWEPNKKLVGALGVLLIFIPLAAAAFTFLGLTQETASRYPCSTKRGAWYALAAAVLCAGAIVFPLTYFATDRGLLEAIASLIPFFIPALALFFFLRLTEKDCRKPWVREQYERGLRANRELWSDPVIAARFGMISGAIWIFAAGLFFLIGFLIGFQFSWLVFIFAVAIQLAVQGLMIKPGTGRDR
jgi:amino acid transporter